MFPAKQELIDKGGELITGNTGGTELRIDVPLPPKAEVNATCTRLEFEHCSAFPPLPANGGEHPW
jgi:hypothetical protein